MRPLRQKLLRESIAMKKILVPDGMLKYVIRERYGLPGKESIFPPNFKEAVIEAYRRGKEGK